MKGLFIDASPQLHRSLLAEALRQRTSVKQLAVRKLSELVSEDVQHALSGDVRDQVLNYVGLAGRRGVAPRRLKSAFKDLLTAQEYDSLVDDLFESGDLHYGKRKRTGQGVLRRITS